MKRRELLKAAAGALTAGQLSTPFLARAQNAKVLRFVPQANLANLDPIWTTLYVVRNASVLFWDTLYGVGSNLEPKPQMVEAHEVSDDGLIWNFRLRPGLKFHDNEPVRAADVKASLERWMIRDNMGQIIKARMDALEAVDDRSFRLRLRQPFPKLLYALGKVGTPIAFVMPERIARTDPYKQISEYVGSGPFRFKRDEWVPGSQAVFERFEGYLPREEKADWLAGGKRVFLDRVEWKVIPDAATAAGALQNGEVDWWENPNSVAFWPSGLGSNVSID
jgi:peptide/nickel transport system substrate-binding protein